MSNHFHLFVVDVSFFHNSPSTGNIELTREKIYEDRVSV
jgi:hypothetical protein